MLRLKKMASLLLALVMLVGVLPLSAMAHPAKAAPVSSRLTRYTVLVLDTSNTADFLYNGQVFYTADTAVEYAKEAANVFLDSVLTANGTNYVAVVSYKGDAQVVSGFSDDINALKTQVSSLSASETVRNMAAGLGAANDLLSQIPDGRNVRKNVVLLSTGMTNAGDYTYSGHYDRSTVGSSWYRTDTQVNLYAYANAAYNIDQVLKEQATVYSLGLFRTMENMPPRGAEIVKFFKLTARDMASSNEYFYEVEDPNDLKFEFGEVAEDILGQGNHFNFAGMLEGDRDSTAEYFYTDDYFFEDPDVYNPSLATMSLCLEYASWSSYNKVNWYDPGLTPEDPGFWEDKLVNLKTLLLGNPDPEAIRKGYGGTGFTNFMANEYWQDIPQKDSIGVAAARKQIADPVTGETGTLVALVVRGGGYGSEWSSNVTVGEEGDHQGFADARDKTLTFLRDYLSWLSPEEAQNVKLWVVGYSRAGAVANMTAGAINSNSALLPCPVSDVYCYTFEAPRGVLRENAVGDHANIHNIINLNDLVPYVAPYAWKFVRYNMAREETFPTAGYANWAEAKGEMLNQLEEMGYLREEYTVPEYSEKQALKIDKSHFLPFGEPLWWFEETKEPTQFILADGVDFLAGDVLKNRAYYVEHMQYVFRQAMGIVFHYNGLAAGAMDYAGEVLDMETFAKKMSELFTMDNMVYIVSPMFQLNLDSFDERMEQVEINLMKKMGSVFAEYAYAKDFLNSLGDILIDLMKDVAKDAWNNDTSSINLVVELADVILQGVINAHYPEITLAWVRSQDPNYTETVVDTPNTGVMRVIRINCPVNVSVYDSTGRRVAAIVNDAPLDCGTFIVSTVNENGEKVVYLPGDEEYQVEIDAVEESQVSYSLSEMNFLQGGETRLQNYYDIPVSQGEVLTGSVPEISRYELEANDADGSTVTYSLMQEGAPVEPDESFAGQEIQREEYTVTLSTEAVSDGIQGGFVDGAGSFLKGSFAQVEASALPGSTFYGWYDESGALVSQDLVYRFPVTGNTALTARFDGVPLYDLYLSNTLGGIVMGMDDQYVPGTTLTLEAKPNPGYYFAGWEAEEEDVTFSSEKRITTFTMPDHRVSITARFEKKPDVTRDVEACLRDGSCPMAPYTDLDRSAWYHDGVHYCVDEGIMNGTGSGIFSPNTTISRGEIITTLWRLEGSPVVDCDMDFTDVADNAWYTEAVRWAFSEDVAAGYGNGRFGTGDPITREQLATIMHRYTQYGGYTVEVGGDTGIRSYADVDTVSDWALEAMRWTCGTGLIRGAADGGVMKLLPAGSATRSQAATILYRFCATY